MMNTGLDEVAIVLVDDALAELLKRLAIRLGPPGPRPAVGVESAPPASIAWVRSWAMPMPIAP